MATPQSFQDLILACDGSPAKIQARYAEHRTARAARQREAFLCASFPGVQREEYLEATEASPSPYAPDGTPLDPRNSLVLWGRPPEHVLRLASCIQAKLKEVAPHLWLMPPRRMHLTVLEIAHSKTPAEIAAAVAPLRPHVRSMVDFTLAHRARLVKPAVSYDAGGVALSFLPAAGEAVVSPAPSPAGVREGLEGEIVGGDGYTYHHLRRDVEGVLEGAGVGVEARYQVPSAHITLARYLGTEDHGTVEQRRRWVGKVEEVNAWLEKEVWGVRGEFIGEWIVGQERGLDLRCGTVWYGGGRSIMAGEGF